MTAREYDANQAAFNKGWILTQICHTAPTQASAPGAWTLCDLNHDDPKRPKYVTHFFNKQDGGFHAGNYFVDVESAYNDWHRRTRLG